MGNFYKMKLSLIRLYEKNAKKRAAAVVEEKKKVTNDENLITDD